MNRRQMDPPSAVELFLAICATLLVAFLAGWAIMKLLTVSYPMVMVDSVTHECVSVWPSTAGSCSNLPEKYETVHVAPQWMRE